MNIEIITIGDELLIGQVVDTNSAWMSRMLNDADFKVVRKTVVGDETETIIDAIDAAKKRVSIVLLTGGLGPTKDDITLRTLCRYFESETYFSEETYANIERIFRQNGRKINMLTRMQAMVPRDCTIIQNQAGTAPCLWFEKDGLTLIAMPGVPSEMKWLMANETLPRLKKCFRQDVFIRHRNFWISGYTESELALHLSDFESHLPPFVKLAYLPQMGIIRLRLSAYYQTESEAEANTEALSMQLTALLHGHIVSDEDKNLETVIGERLRSLHATVSTAESCTGGAIAAVLTSVAGSSDYFTGSVVAYSNKAKQYLLGVSSDDLDQYGAVSRKVVTQMAIGALKAFDSDFSVATSGIAGPGGGTTEKPVGTVWIAVASKCDESMITKQFSFGILREQNILRTVNAALLMLIELFERCKSV